MIYGILILIAVAALGLYFWGRRLPPVQQLTRDVLINAPADRVWAVMTDYLRQVEWRSDLVSVEMAASLPGQEAWIERPLRGRPSACRIARQKTGYFVEVERLPNGVSSGHRSATLEPAARATRLTLCETLMIDNPFVRVWLRTALDPAAALENYERDLKRRVEAQCSEANAPSH